jgi:hypothetical protein
MFAFTTLATWVKSLLCSPSPKMVGDWSLSNAIINSGMTAEYCECGSCFGPNTLKYRSDTVSSPYVL